MNRLRFAIALSIICAPALAAPNDPPKRRDNRIRIAIAGVRLVNVDEKTGSLFTDFLAQKMAKETKLSVTTPNEMAAVIGFERQRQLLGCTDDSSCLAELAGGLGVDGLIAGSIGRVGNQLVASLKLVRASDATPLGSYGTRAKDDSALLDWMSEIADKMSSDAVAAFPDVGARPPLEAPQPKVSGAGADSQGGQDPRSADVTAAEHRPDGGTHPAAQRTNPPPRGPAAAPGNVLPLLAAGGAVAAGAAAVLFNVAARSEADKLRTFSFTRHEEMLEALDAAKRQELISIGFAATSALLGGVSIWLFADRGAARPAVAVTPVGGGAVASWGGVFP